MYAVASRSVSSTASGNPIETRSPVTIDDASHRRVRSCSGLAMLIASNAANESAASINPSDSSPLSITSL